MKPELEDLPMDVWADAFVYPWISRQQLAQIVHRFKERAFAEKLQTFLHDPKCGKRTLRSFKISSNPWKNSEFRASLEATPTNTYGHWYGTCEFPETEVPENFKSFKRLSIRHFDDDVLGFLTKIKPLFTNVYLNLGDMSLYGETATNVRIILDHLLPMLAGIRGRDHDTSLQTTSLHIHI